MNLQSADTCILYDSDWNPQPDLQASPYAVVPKTIIATVTANSTMELFDDAVGVMVMQPLL